jgi:hypothetical protein
LLAPSENKDIQKVSFGEEPVKLSKYSKKYLIKNLKIIKQQRLNLLINLLN